MNVAKWFTVVVLLSAVGLGGASGQTLTNLYSFTGGNDGGTLFTGPVQGSDGSFYGTTWAGGAYGSGTVYRISSTGSLTTLWSFTGGADGGVPRRLAKGNDGNLYGITQYGGTSTGRYVNCGTVFRVTPNGAFTNLYSFTGPPDGENPISGLVQGSDGHLYGTTYAGGANPMSAGTVFRISASGAYTSLYSFASSFAGGSDGANPYGGMVQGPDGNFYGTTYAGGSSAAGTVFRITPGGGETNLHSFGGGYVDGGQPYGDLIRGSDGNLYGTTYDGGRDGLGTVFRISPSGVYTSLYSLGGYPLDGAYVFAGLVLGSDGNLYGTTGSGGSNAVGTIFQISTNRIESNLFSFSNSYSQYYGDDPWASLVQASDGSFYGTTMLGGKYGQGNLFRFCTPLNPPANQISSVQPDVSGTNLVFRIPSVAGETYQLQFSASMNPTNWTNVPGVSVTNSIGAMLTLTNFGGAVGPQGFYRFAITP